MLFVESALLAALAAPPSIAVAYSAPRLLRSLIPQLPYYPFAVDSSVLAFLAAVTLFAGAIAGIAPALESLKKDVSAALHGHEAVGGATGWRARDLLVAAQVGMSLVLLVGAGLFLRAEARLLAANPGYDIDHVMLVVPRVTVPPHTPESAASFYKAFVQRVVGVPGVGGVAYARGPADEGAASPATTIAAGDTGVIATAAASVVSSEYFRTLQIPVLTGAPFGDDAISARSVVISESLARTLWSNRMPVGRVARLGNSEVSVAGVVRDVQSPVSGTGERTIYLPAGAIRPGDGVYVSFQGAESRMAGAIRDEIAGLDPNAIAQPLTLAALRRDQASKFMPFVEMVIGLGIVGLALGVAGIYGVVSFMVARRTREMGIRIALGATRADIVRTVIWSSAAPIAFGIGGGLALALVGARTLSRIFSDTPVHMESWDPIVYFGVMFLLCAAVIAAMIGPAERAAAADPVHALRQD
jgi:predicted permease